MIFSGAQAATQRARLAQSATGSQSWLQAHSLRQCCIVDGGYQGQHKQHHDLQRRWAGSQEIRRSGQSSWHRDPAAQMVLHSRPCRQLAAPAPQAPHPPCRRGAGSGSAGTGPAESHPCCPGDPNSASREVKQCAASWPGPYKASGATTACRRPAGCRTTAAAGAAAAAAGRPRPRPGTCRDLHLGGGGASSKGVPTSQAAITREYRWGAGRRPRYCLSIHRAVQG